MTLNFQQEIGTVMRGTGVFQMTQGFYLDGVYELSCKVYVEMD